MVNPRQPPAHLPPSRARSHRSEVPPATVSILERVQMHSMHSMHSMQAPPVHLMLPLMPSRSAITSARTGTSSASQASTSGTSAHLSLTPPQLPRVQTGTKSSGIGARVPREESAGGGEERVPTGVSPVHRHGFRHARVRKSALRCEVSAECRLLRK